MVIDGESLWLLCFPDYGLIPLPQRAFDSVELPFAREYLDYAGMPEPVSDFFFEQLRGAQAHVVCRYGRCSDQDFDIVRGGKMGAIETPMLFICILDPLLHMLEQRYPGALINAYADDLLIGHSDPVILAQMVDEIRRFIAVAGAQVHPGKSKTMKSAANSIQTT